MPRCPGCEEPLEPGDLFCGACGYDLSAVPEPPQDRPTIPIAAPPAGEPGAGTGAGTGFGQAPGTAPGTGFGRAPAGEPAPGAGFGQAPAPAGEPGTAPGTGFGQAPAGEPAPGAGFGQAPAPAGDPAPGAGYGPGASGDFELAAPAAAGSAPDPRTSPDLGPDPAPAPSAGGKVCVACRAGRVDDDGYCENCGHAQPRERDHMEQELGSVAAVSDRGLRHHRNEDSFAVSTTALPDGSPAVVAIVCDGVSSASRPDEASAAAAHAANEALLESLPRGTHPQQAMHEAIVAAAESVNRLANDAGQAQEQDPHRHQNAPACTLVGAIMVSGLLVVGWVGDSRAYWVPEDRAGAPARLTEDDSWAAQMVAAGLMNEAEAYADERAHAITGWLGADAYELEPHTASFKPDRPGLVVVCTDGLWNYAESASEMAAAVPEDAYERPLHGAQALVGHALDGGGHDNVTVALVPFAVPPQGAGSA